MNYALLKSCPVLAPEGAGELVPAEDGGTEEVGGVAIEHLLCLLVVTMAELLPRLLDKG